MSATCEVCNRPIETTMLMVSIHKGGVPTHVCLECIDWLKVLADRLRQRPGWSNGELMSHVNQI